jgi:hypothetical protein
MRQKRGEYRVFLFGVGDGSEAAKELFCQKISKRLGISFPLLKKIVQGCPVVFKKDLSLEKAVALAKVLRSFGAEAGVEEKRERVPIILEFGKADPHPIALESCILRRGQDGSWNAVGRARNISAENLNDTWVLIQLFERSDEFLAFEEVPLAINPLPPEESSPFKAVFEGHLPVQKVSVAFKNCSGSVVSALDRRRPDQEWVSIPFEREKDKEGVFFVRLDDTPEEIGSEELPGKKPEEASNVTRDDRQGSGSQPLEKTSHESPEVSSPEVGSDDSEKGIVIQVDLPGGKRGEEEESVQAFDPGLLMLEVAKEEEAQEEEIVFAEPGNLAENEGLTQELRVEGSQEGESPPLSEVISAKVVQEEVSSFPWMDDFRNSIDSFYLENRNPFLAWFESSRRGGEFQTPFQMVLTILAHARFDQMSHPGRVLENTQRVFRIILRPNMPLEEIPSLEGTQFFSGDHWRDLFHRALPKLQQIAQNMMEKEIWDASELERLIQVIPHMSNKTSRMAVRWVHELIPDVVAIDFSNTPVFVGESLYRVACRLGIVDPYFDHYDSRNSAGDTKIQSFAREAFPSYPIRIEEPMAWIGMNEERGHCFPTQPRCQGCLFENFCPRLYLHFNPSEKGMPGH